MTEALVNQAPTDLGLPAAWLDGSLPVHPEFAPYSDEEMWHFWPAQHERTLEEMFRLCDILVENVRRAGPSRPARAEALSRARAAINKSHRTIEGMFLFGRIFPPAERPEGFASTLDWSHLDEVVTRLKVSQIPFEEARQRALVAVAIAQGRELNCKKTRQLTQVLTERRVLDEDAAEQVAAELFDAPGREPESAPEPEVWETLGETEPAPVRQEIIQHEAAYPLHAPEEALCLAFREGLALDLARRTSLEPKEAAEVTDYIDSRLRRALRGYVVARRESMGWQTGL